MDPLVKLLDSHRKFNLIVEKQMKSLQKATIAAKAELEEAKRDQAQSSETVEDKVRSAAVSEQGRQEALVDLDRMKRALDIETIKSTCRHA